MSHRSARNSLAPPPGPGGCGAARVLPDHMKHGCQDRGISLVPAQLLGGYAPCPLTGLQGFRDLFPSPIHVCVSLSNDWRRESRKDGKPERLRCRGGMVPCSALRPRRAAGAGLAAARPPHRCWRFAAAARAGGGLPLGPGDPAAAGAASPAWRGGGAASAVRAAATRPPARRIEVAHSALPSSPGYRLGTGRGSSLEVWSCGCQDPESCVVSGPGNGFTRAVSL